MSVPSAKRGRLASMGAFPGKATGRRSSSPTLHGFSTSREDTSCSPAPRRSRAFRILLARIGNLSLFAPAWIPRTRSNALPAVSFSSAAVHRCGTPTRASSATGMSPGCPMTGRRTAGSMQDGLREVAKLPEITATNEGSAVSIREHLDLVATQVPVRIFCDFAAADLSGGRRWLDQQRRLRRTARAGRHLFRRPTPRTGATARAGWCRC
ncbi:hypothetical protein BQ8482_160001 [Mesorhizobium delmotii]|uniref:Uncharacterized protein n=1 Tax=Mesorhizobium delmotii TaxID=1631247 RepID=A0A2P9AHA6_9HYPH|nr:hypothetical protein BQ8482_160001 [Mesorhizobium delmotii]